MSRDVTQHATALIGHIHPVDPALRQFMLGFEDLAAAVSPTAFNPHPPTPVNP
jgi:hypothetical protein